MRLEGSHVFPIPLLPMYKESRPMPVDIPNSGIKAATEKGVVAYQ